MMIELSNVQLRQLIIEGETYCGRIVIRRLPTFEDDGPEVRLKE